MSRILVVEDERAIAFALDADLRSEGYAVTVATAGDQGLELARAEPFDLVLLDVMLPGKDGFEVCRELRRGGFRAPIIMLTAKAQEAEVAQACGQLWIHRRKNWPSCMRGRTSPRPAGSTFTNWGTC